MNPFKILYGWTKKKKKTLEHILVERVQEKKTCMIFLRMIRLNVSIWMIKKPDIFKFKRCPLPQIRIQLEIRIYFLLFIFIYIYMDMCTSSLTSC